MSGRPIVLWDTCALLVLFDEVNKASRVDGALKSQKLPFLAEIEGQKQNLAVASFPYIRYHFGPFSAVLRDTVELMQSQGLISSTSGAPTPKGKYIIDVAADSISQSTDATKAVEILRRVGSQYGKRSGTSLKEMIYRLAVPVLDAADEEMTVKKIPHGYQIINPARDPRLTRIDPFDADTRQEILAELVMPESVLNRESTGYKKTISEALTRVAEVCG